jgi:GDP-L-fucose synthase
LKIYVAGHTGMVGSAIVRNIESHGQHEWVGKTRQELDLTNRAAVFDFLANERPEALIIAAAKVGGIVANSTFPVQFLSDNIQIEANLIDGAHAAGIGKVLFLGSSCIYPKFAEQPIKEESLLTGALEPTNEYYALAKIAGLKLIEAYRKQHGHSWISLMPTNLYGPNDNFDELSSHVIPGMIAKFERARQENSETVTLWGTGTPLREFLHVDDLADACIFALSNYTGDLALNVGSGYEVSIRDLAELIAEIVGFEGEILWDKSKPDGTPRKRLDTSRLDSLGWSAAIDLRTGLTDLVKHRQAKVS